ncbi:uncharacterized protein LAESUDRAFT_814285 [Laetiporus sulphureus 93-53]|uniref:Uncharacterized protein n=1 Tax=Laetiporus sulphureus 93-53 TaxID=1314785 RepID=A0A165D2K8_9APHY|nr:uncharacterized protein LAESUDRAFT_814285 [Laetiporus sulphureus 93-53]KZT04031.1 hypothetical protein LAESUDRAFT_814285 [Laetiporus sulphureus 93-53]
MHGKHWKSIGDRCEQRAGHEARASQILTEDSLDQATGHNHLAIVDAALLFFTSIRTMGSRYATFGQSRHFTEHNTPSHGNPIPSSSELQQQLRKEIEHQLRPRFEQHQKAKEEALENGVGPDEAEREFRRNVTQLRRVADQRFEQAMGQYRRGARPSPGQQLDESSIQRQDTIWRAITRRNEGLQEPDFLYRRTETIDAIGGPSRAGPPAWPPNNLSREEPPSNEPAFGDSFAMPGSYEEEQSQRTEGNAWSELGRSPFGHGHLRSRTPLNLDAWRSAGVHDSGTVFQGLHPNASLPSRSRHSSDSQRHAPQPFVSAVPSGSRDYANNDLSEVLSDANLRDLARTLMNGDMNVHAKETARTPQLPRQFPAHLYPHLAERSQSTTPKPGVPHPLRTGIRAAEDVHPSRPPIFGSPFTGTLENENRPAVHVPHAEYWLPPSSSDMQPVDPSTFTIDDDSRSILSPMIPYANLGKASMSDAGTHPFQHPTQTSSDRMAQGQSGRSSALTPEGIEMINADEGDSDWEAPEFTELDKEELDKIISADLPSILEGVEAIHEKYAAQPAAQPLEQPKGVTVTEVPDEAEVDLVEEPQEVQKKPAKVGKAKRKEEAKRREEARRKAEEARQKEDEVRKQKEQEAQEEREARRLEEERKKAEEQRAFEEEHRLKEPEARFAREQAELRRQAETRQRKDSWARTPAAASKQDAIKNESKDLAKKATDGKWTGNELRKKEEELRKTAELLSLQEEEQKRREQELAMREQEMESRHVDEDRRRMPGALRNREVELRAREREIQRQGEENRKNAEKICKKDIELTHREEALNRMAQEMFARLESYREEMRREWLSMGGELS